MKINFSSSKVIMDGIDTKDWKFDNIKNFCGKTVPVKGFFFTQGDYGEQVVIVSDNILINMPVRAVKEFQDIKANAEYVAALKAGKMYFDNIHEEEFKKGKGTAYDINIED